MSLPPPTFLVPPSLFKKPPPPPPPKKRRPPQPHRARQPALQDDRNDPRHQVDAPRLPGPAGTDPGPRPLPRLVRSRRRVDVQLRDDDGGVDARRAQAEVHLARPALGHASAARGRARRKSALRLVRCPRRVCLHHRESDSGMGELVEAEGGHGRGAGAVYGQRQRPVPHRHLPGHAARREPSGGEYLRQSLCSRCCSRRLFLLRDDSDLPGGQRRLGRSLGPFAPLGSREGDFRDRVPQLRRRYESLIFPRFFLPLSAVLFRGSARRGNRRSHSRCPSNLPKTPKTESGKFSKSRGLGVFGDDAARAGLAPDAWRFYLLSSRPETADTDFKWSDLAARTNAELLANLGNFCHRALSFAAAKLGGVVPESAAEVSTSSSALLAESDVVKIAAAAAADLSAKVAPLAASYVAAMEKAKLREGARLLMVRFFRVFFRGFPPFRIERERG